MKDDQTTKKSWNNNPKFSRGYENRNEKTSNANNGKKNLLGKMKKKNLLGNFSSRVATAIDRISELEDELHISSI